MRFWVLSILLTSWVASCDFETDTPRPWMVSQTGVGDLAFGMTRTQAEQYVGEQLNGAWSDGLDGRFWFAKEYEIGAYGTIWLYFISNDAFEEPVLDFFSMRHGFREKRI